MNVSIGRWRTWPGDCYIRRLRYNIFLARNLIIVLCYCVVKTDASRRPFRFHAMWISHPSFGDFVKGTWDAADADFLHLHFGPQILES